MRLPPLDFESSASTSFTTSAIVYSVMKDLFDVFFAQISDHKSVIYNGGKVFYRAGDRCLQCPVKLDHVEKD